jgi:hypothetical protein
MPETLKSLYIFFLKKKKKETKHMSIFIILIGFNKNLYLEF